MKLQQGQIWKLEAQYLRITRLERLAVEYKTLKDPKLREGTHHRATKKEFCRLLKQAALISSAEVQPVTDS